MRIRLTRTAIALAWGSIILAGCTEKPTAPPVATGPSLQADVLATTASGYLQVSAGRWYNCAVRADHSLVCWGWNGNGQSTPPTGTGFAQVSASVGHTCVVKTDGSLACWGDNYYGESTPPIETDFAHVTVGNGYTCALRTDGSLICWGWNHVGQSSPPVGAHFVQASAGRFSTCGVKADGSVACWGFLEDGGGTHYAPPTGSGFAQVSMGRYHACAVKTDGSLACWGSALNMTPPPGTNFVQVSAGEIHTCALKTDGSLACWGNNYYGQSTVPPGTNFVQVSAGGQHTCALKTDGSLACWGDDVYGGATPPNNPPLANFTPRPSTVAEGMVVTFDAGNSSDPDGDALTYTWGFGDGTTGSAVTASHSYVDEGSGSYTITLTVADPSGATATASGAVTVTNAAPVLDAISGPTDPLAIGTSASITGTFTDPGTLDTHGATVDWGDGTTSAATITEASGSGSLANSHNYLSPGVYEVSVTLADDDGATATALLRYVVVYDPVGGFATGAGWINSPAGACRLVGCTDATVGKAMFGFVNRYQKGATSPTGTTEFQFKDGGLRFTSESHQWFVVSGPQVQFKGTGTVNGVAGYGFLLTARDGDQPGGGSEDRFRIKIWDANGTVVYDNQMGAADNSNAATALGGGQIQVHP